MWACQGITYTSLCQMSAEFGNPIVAAIQAWHEGQLPPDGYRHVWNDGHFVVVTWADDQGVLCMDPSCSERAFVPKEEWLERWHDLDVGDPRIIQTALIFPAAVVRRKRMGRVREMG